jgi:uncharacterized membrane protein
MSRATHVLAWSFGSALVFAAFAFVIGMFDAPSNPPPGWESLPFWDRVEIHGANYEAIWWGMIGLVVGTAVGGGWRVLGWVGLGALSGALLGILLGVVGVAISSLHPAREGYVALIPFLFGGAGFFLGAAVGFVFGLVRLSRKPPPSLPALPSR